ncbi:MAG: phosphoribosylanthranilate isomerase [Alphaproteobacteria bacterium]|nr:phosphoribosylanthranilate isomerase [Alphaproteobacteria bacterium]
MTVAAKICGINDAAAMNAAVSGGARAVGLVFYAPSPRYVTPAQAAALAGTVPETVDKVGLLVDEEDDVIAAILDAIGLDLLQLHGSESPDRVAAIKSRFGLPVMKAVKVAGAADLERVAAYEAVADRILFDAKPPTEMTDALPGGNALSFDWHLLDGRAWALPWMLSGGLDAANVAAAVRISGATYVDVSSGVEDRPGVKNPEKIREFLAIVASL